MFIKDQSINQSINQAVIEMGDYVFRLDLVSALTVGLVRPELSNCRFKAKIVTKSINAFG